MTPRPAHSYRGARRNRDVGPDAKLRKFRNRLALERGVPYTEPAGPGLPAWEWRARGVKRRYDPRSSWPGALKPHLSPGSFYRTQFS